MKVIKIAKAGPFTADRPVQPVVIEVSDDIPESSLRTLDDSRAFHEAQAELIVEALFNSLPQGTFDRLWIKMAQKKTSLYRGLADS